ncbi:electron transporter [Leptolyngbya sp. 'hensonii']|uniref:cyclic electron transport protein PGR5 n=1 Tax=Leptolyngbya sp. 'hensonii' TaxID=1922337 RepID=UPI0009500DAB|nr:electron transporter [Leptolyngbya sp. 'hensonii']OLP16455.1 electron transporter [Leptolyngbya sp. 'hensonii']
MFAPIVCLLRNRIGKAKFNQMRGQAIAIHAEVITAFCEGMTIDRTQRQNLIRLARDNGKRLGFLA